MRTLKLTTPYMQGKDVKDAQRALNAYGAWAGKVDGVFGEQTARAAAQAKYMLGYADKQCTQTYGEALHKFLTGERKPSVLMQYRAKQRKSNQPMREEALRVALSFEGVKEDPAGSNRVMFSEWYNLIGPWCAMFVTYCYVQAGSKAFQRGSRWAYCPYMLADARAQRNGLTIVPKENVQPGDVVLFSWDQDGVANHVGMVITPPNRSGNFTAVEGNTSTSDNSNGGEVMIRNRNTSSVIGFVRVIN